MGRFGDDPLRVLRVARQSALFGAEPDAVLAAWRDERKRVHSELFVRPRDPEREIWDGRRAGVAGARERYGAAFDAVLGTCRIWVNGEPAEAEDTIGATDELAVLPPVSGG